MEKIECTCDDCLTSFEVLAGELEKEPITVVCPHCGGEEFGWMDNAGDGEE